MAQHLWSLLGSSRCVYLKLSVKACATAMVLIVFVFGLVLPSLGSISEDALGIGLGGGSPQS